MGHGKNISLKATLQSQQSRLKAKQKAVHAEQVAVQKGKQKRGRKSNSPSPIIPFRPTDKILLIGEGNFSFTRALLVDPPAELEHFPATSITATSYDSEETCYTKYSNAKGIVETLRTRGAEVLFGVDATKLHKCPAFKGRRWDKIVWNFPHAGKGIRDQDRNILSNQQLVLDFLRSAPSCLSLGPIPSAHQKRRRKMSDDDEDLDAASDPDTEDPLPPTTAGSGRGTILITLRNVPPYTTWDIPRLAKSPPKPSRTGETPNPRFKLLRSFVFHRHLWKGYEHRMTKGERAHGEGTTGTGGEDRTWEFCLQD